ncbi:BLUF domain-containing protein [Pedobacter boryungensis]|uniref:BLUF domain-containing protein n=1 Tax=Pedobacter boryungensis TaxID=869962 RepID=A0ABX2D9M2_9SPHI|nr:BLUF domain-containing protein [Pedobacter boryungensis]NQX30751.1 BLUF domain-containing protein [Pedobacter boryungensis]
MYYYLLYFGVAKNDFTEQDFDVLLEQARSRNHYLGITGKLLHCEGAFIQLLEGLEVAVKEVYDSIRIDERLVAIKKITEGHCEERYYADWTMEFKDVGIEEINKMENCSHPNVTEYVKTASAVKLLKLLAKS